jgi:hypothetical protein
MLECNQSLRCECRFRPISIAHQTFKLHYRNLLYHFTKQIYQANELWGSVISEYAGRKLTVSSDRLPALSGVARESKYSAIASTCQGIAKMMILQLALRGSPRRRMLPCPMDIGRHLGLGHPWRVSLNPPPCAVTETILGKTKFQRSNAIPSHVIRPAQSVGAIFARGVSFSEVCWKSFMENTSFEEIDARAFSTGIADSPPPPSVLAMNYHAGILGMPKDPLEESTATKW